MLTGGLLTPFACTVVAQIQRSRGTWPDDTPPTGLRHGGNATTDEEAAITAIEERDHIDARHCPRCGASGILPLAQPREPDGTIKNPLMICPVCDDAFRATGMTWLGAFRPAPDAEAGE